jgi:hypothetical protein
VELGGVNGQPALITRDGSHPLSVLTIEVETGQIRTIRVVANPEKLTPVYHYMGAFVTRMDP